MPPDKPTRYGIFTDALLILGPFASRQQAEAAQGSVWSWSGRTDVYPVCADGIHPAHDCGDTQGDDYDD